MPDKQRLDMAIKYSTIDKRSLLDHVNAIIKIRQVGLLIGAMMFRCLTCGRQQHRLY